MEGGAAAPPFFMREPVPIGCRSTSAGGVFYRRLRVSGVSSCSSCRAVSVWPDFFSGSGSSRRLVRMATAMVASMPATPFLTTGRVMAATAATAMVVSAGTATTITRVPASTSTIVHGVPIGGMTASAATGRDVAVISAEAGRVSGAASPIAAATGLDGPAIVAMDREYRVRLRLAPTVTGLIVG